MTKIEELKEHFKLPIYFNDKKVSNTISDRSLPLPLFQLKTISEPCLSDTFAGINSDKTSLNEDYQFSRMMLGTVNNGIELERKIDDERGINHQINPFGKSGSNNDNQGTNYNYPSIEKPSNLSNINLAHISESQKYLKVIPSDKDDSVKLETINGKEYCVKLKELYMNEEGEWVMTLRNVAKNIFLELNYIKGAESLPESKGNIENKLIEKP